EEVAERKSIDVRVLVERIEDVRAGCGGVSGESKETGDRSDQEADDEHGYSGAAAGADNRGRGGSFGLAREPVANEKREAGKARCDVILLSSGETEEQKDDGGPAEEQQEDGFRGTSNSQNPKQTQTDLGEGLRKKGTPRKKPQQ